MCFSAPASFAAGAALIPAGMYCTQAALRKNLRYLPLALVPVAFGTQQAIEGMVWVNLARHDAAMIQTTSLLFLAIAVAFWPAWIPLSVLMIETRKNVRWLLGLIFLIGLTWCWLYYPLLAEPDRYLETIVVKHSIRYEVADLPGFQYLPRAVWRLAYLAVITLPLGLAQFDLRPGRNGRLFAGLLIGGLFGVTYLFFWHAYLSVWCFFAAVASLLLCSVFRHLPKQAAIENQPAEAVTV